MKAACVAVLLAGFLTCAPARAEPVPAAMLDKDYQTCMGGVSEAEDPQRAQYCACIRDGMKDWSLDAYGNVVEEQAKAGTSQTVASQVAALGQACIAKVMR